MSLRPGTDWAGAKYLLCRHLLKLCYSCLLAPATFALSSKWCIKWRRTQGSRLTVLELLKGPHFNNLLGHWDVVNLSGYFLLSRANAFLRVF